MAYNRKDYTAIQQVLWRALVANILVAIGKLIYGLFTGTLVMIADGIHSLLDGGSSLMGIIAVRSAQKPSDHDHHYGHHKYETIAALGIGFFIALTSWEIVKHALQRLWEHNIPGFHYSGYIVVACSLVVSLLLSRYERRKGKELKSSVLEADAYHTATDVWVSVSVLISLVAIHYEQFWADSLFSLAISVYFALVAFRLVKKNLLELSDAAFMNPEDIRRVVMEVPGVLSCHNIRTRGYPGSAFIDLHVQVDPDTRTLRSHSIAHEIEEQVKTQLDGVRDILIHTEPYPDFDDESSTPS